LSTLALEGSDAAASGRRPGVLLRYGDLCLLALALPIFVAAGLPLLGYAVAAAAWLTQHAMIVLGDRASKAALANRDRNRALGIVAASTLGRVWLVALAILLVGLLGEREDGLAAALLTLALVTVHLGCLAFSKLVYPETRETRAT
jgi:L-asparagine transporter-like permease